MIKTSNIYVKVEPNVKAQAEAVLDKLGIWMSSAVSIFLKQIIKHNGLPFDVKIPFNKPIPVFNLKEDGFNLGLAKAEDDFKNGKAYSFKEVKKELLKGLGEDI